MLDSKYYNNEDSLKAFILYCQAVEATHQIVVEEYYKWKNYWMDYLMNKKEN